ncbi:SHOCT domain-containing protein [Streptomyces sp. NBC_01408]|uniref:SHOCT domain-containing protein n=1 Tax=Streptomyces sp. NBC_01408 TaxID=2903855 RepID=UPI002255A849|nr:SHOCT domain-containing protein [Streptomyces sp. NBC_01408]MCX4691020.1 SHOCT domain-containing protein [Streptomyces sp. NBC_01408]
MFIRPVGVAVTPADRPRGRPLLRGLLARAAGAPEAGTVHPDTPPGRPAPGPPGRTEPDEPWPDETPWPEDQPWPEEPADTDSPDPGPADTPRAGLAAELAQLADLARQGHLTPEEFTRAKARLLGG